ncbi:MAG TPA: hypothetical protein VFY78_02425, partial [Gammaproteobacteria bacterium]|nr:hypothetical protein [Gammaproteobacteria bacterium]
MCNTVLTQLAMVTALTALTACGGGDSSTPVTPPTLSNLIFSRDVGGQTDLFLIKEDGTGIVTLADSADAESLLGVTNSGRVIYSRYAGNNNFDIYSV